MILDHIFSDFPISVPGGAAPGRELRARGPAGGGARAAAGARPAAAAGARLAVGSAGGMMQLFWIFSGEISVFV